VSLVVHALTQLIAALPRVENPLPESVGLDLPFSAAGIGGVLGNVFAAGRSPEEQARVIALVGLWFFRLGVLGYSFLLVNQLLSSG
jgi:hypothetical protein